LRPGAGGSHLYPSYLRSRDQEDHGLKPAWEDRSARPYLIKNHFQKRAGGVAQGVGPEFKLLYCKKKERKKEIQKDKKGRVR
jgi:hypothetical protein